MNEDHTFRMVLVVGCLVVLPIGLSYRIKSQATREKLDRWQEGLFILATLRPVGLIFWLGLIAYMVDPFWMAWSATPLPAWLRWTGVGLCATGSGLLIWTFQRLGKNLTDTVVTRREHTLVMDGPYRWVRHPLYDSGALFILGSSLLAANWFLFVLGVVIIGLLLIRTCTEEAKLLARFGDKDKVYMERTGRFVPGIRASDKKEHGR